MRKLIAILILLLTLVTCIACVSCARKEAEMERLASRCKAYEKDMDGMADEIIAHELTTRELAHGNDVLNLKIDSLRDELGVARRKMQAAYVREVLVTRVDTVKLRDTLMVEGASVDTTIGDRWYTLRLRLEHPDIVTVEPKFRNQLGIVVSTKRETVEPPRRFFLFRLFQRKQDVTVVDVTDSSPYCETAMQRYVKITRR